jgi:hypothetical protein
MITDAKYIQRDETPKRVFNPLSEDFVDKIRDDGNVVQEYIVCSMEIVTFPTYLANRIITDLITMIKNQRQSGFLTPEQESKLRKEVEV